MPPRFRLFNHYRVGGEFQFGKGDPEGTPWFCTSWHKYLRQLDAKLSDVDGIAQAGGEIFGH